MKARLGPLHRLDRVLVPQLDLVLTEDAFLAVFVTQTVRRIDAARVVLGIWFRGIRGIGEARAVRKIVGAARLGPFPGARDQRAKDGERGRQDAGG